jgi:hypothetical protein
VVGTSSDCGTTMSSGLVGFVSGVRAGLHIQVARREKLSKCGGISVCCDASVTKRVRVRNGRDKKKNCVVQDSLYKRFWTKCVGCSAGMSPQHPMLRVQKTVENSC